ncbi:hypothetical protein KOW79_013605 [Hemibagrus wyckioides]|uniref:Uncharacterized protein n=1 Tax=Hemibagrus wyckioides TaxID=337641 RepID=A0A9D3NIA3_9TELE|nr:hypothetical protein KOW79_013605 [Hemibagrus wyckioides]
MKNLMLRFTRIIVDTATETHGVSGFLPSSLCPLKHCKLTVCLYEPVGRLFCSLEFEARKSVAWETPSFIYIEEGAGQEDGTDTDTTTDTHTCLCNGLISVAK